MARRCTMIRNEAGQVVGWATRDDRRDDGREPFVVGRGELVRETGKAILVDLRGKPDAFGGVTSSELWVPKSVLHDDSEIYGVEDRSSIDPTAGQAGKLVVFRWWATKEQLRKADDDG